MKIVSTLMLLVGWPFLVLTVFIYVAASVSLAVASSVIDVWARP